MLFAALPRSLHRCTLLVAGLLAGCAVGPDYVRPALSLPDRFTAAAVETEAATAVTAPKPVDSSEVPVQHLSKALDIPAQWWQAFRSEPLNAWVEASLAHNPNVEAAQAALRAAQENALAESGAFWPQVALNFTPTRQHIADTIASPLSNNATTYNLHTAQVTVSYAPDVFGGTRRAVEAAQAQTEQQRFQYEATYLTLSANVVTAAITEAALRAQRDTTHAIIAEQKDVLASYYRQQALGQASLADVDAQEAALASTEATLPPLDKQLGVQRNLLATLAGRYPAEQGDTHFELAALELPSELPLTLPADLVEHRPDVRAAEAQLHAASAGIGVAVAARLPNVQLGVNAYGSSALALS
ncbi:MAG TPA: efflux transporter outer membrane subunit, partial [Variovorax sp.]